MDRITALENENARQYAMQAQNEQYNSVTTNTLYKSVSRLEQKVDKLIILIENINTQKQEDLT